MASSQHYRYRKKGYAEIRSNVYVKHLSNLLHFDNPKQSMHLINGACHDKSSPVSEVPIARASNLKQDKKK